MKLIDDVRARRPALQRETMPRAKRFAIVGLPALFVLAITGSVSLGLVVAGLILAALYVPAWDVLPLGKWIVPLTVIVLAFLYPFYQPDLFDVVIFGNFPSVDTGVTMLIFIMMALGLNIVVGYAGLLDLGYVAFYAMGAYTAAWFASQHFSTVDAPPRRRRRRPRGARDSRLDLARAHGRRDSHGGRRDHHRLPDASAPRRLPRDRHARLRRDHAPGREQRRPSPRVQRHERAAGHQPDRPARFRRHPAQRRRPAYGLPELDRTASGSSTGLRSGSSCSRSSARSGCATRGWDAPGSRSVRTRRPPPRWACR